jgi:hypothetical protein
MDAHWRLYAGQEPGPALDLSRAQVALLPTGSRGVDFLLQRGWAVAYADRLAAVAVRVSPGAKPPVFAAGSEAAILGSAPFSDDVPVLATRLNPKP